MQETGTAVWTTAPERRFSDVVCSPRGVNWDAEQTREALRLGRTTLSAAYSEARPLLLPPPRAFAPKRAGGRRDLHCHRYTEVGIVTRGEMLLWWEGVEVRCPAGSVFVIPPGLRYLPHVQQVSGYLVLPHSVTWLALHPGCAISHTCVLEGKEHRLGEYCGFTEPRVTGQARSLAQELSDRAEGYETVVRGILLCLLTWLLRAPVYSISRQASGERPERASTESPDSFQSRVESYLLSNYHRPLTLPQVARAVECSPAHLCRRFRDLTGQTPFQYLRDVRIAAAKRLLQADIPIARVAEMVGFDDPLYFSKVFSGQTGESPRSFRARGGQYFP